MRQLSRKVRAATGLVSRRWASGAQPAPAEAATRGPKALDRPAGAIQLPKDGQTVERSPVLVSGWALAPDATVVRVTVLVEGRPVSRARLATPQAKLASRCEQPESPICGFDHWIDPAALPASSRMRIGVTVELSTGLRYSLPDVTVTIEGASPRLGDSDRQAAARPEGPGAGARVAPRPVEGAIRLLAFTNDLLYGGSQLYLLELLRSLSAGSDLSGVVVSPKDGPLRQRFEGSGFPVHVSRVKTATERSYEESLGELADWARTGSFNFVLANGKRSFAAVDLAARLKLPSVWAIQNSLRFSRWTKDFKASYPPYVRERMSQAFGLTQALVFAAEATRRQYVHLADGRRSLVLPYGIDLRRIDDYRQRLGRRQARRELGISEDTRVLLCLGTITERKGQAALAKAFSLIADRHPDARLYLVGDRDTEYSRALREYLRRDSQDRTVIVPVTTDPFCWHVAADAFVLASNNESLPISIIEAMAFETPVLATEIFGVPELIRDGETGYLCADRDIASLAQGLHRMLSARAQDTQAMTCRAAETVHATHDLQSYVTSFSRLLDSVSRDPGGLPAVSAGEPRPAHST
jgi:D-inositol-3-phosphate glycosyltransferase